MVKLYTGTFIFDWQVLKNILSNNMGIVLLLFAAMVFIMVGIIKYYIWTLAQRRNCQIQYVELEQIATNWLAFNDVEDNIRDRVESELSQGTKTIPAAHSAAIGLKMLDLTKEDSRIFAKEHLAPYMDRFSEQEQTVAFSLLAFLDKEGGVPSVSSMFQNDPEVLAYSSKEVQLGGKATFDILATFTLLDHTIRVAKNIIDIIENIGESSHKLLYARCIIAALAHDIGKIEAKQYSKIIRGELYRTNPHEQMSVVMLQEMFPEYEGLNELQGYVRSHHIGKTESEIAKYLKTADAKSREQEISLWLMTHKQNLVDKAETAPVKTKEEEKPKPVKKGEEAVKTEPIIPQVPISDVPTKHDYFADMFEPPAQEVLVDHKIEEIEPSATPEPTAHESKTEKKTRTVKKTEPINGYAFDFYQTYQYELSAKLASSVNMAEKDKILRELKIQSVSFGDKILFDVMFFKKTVEEVLAKRVDLQFIRGLVAQLSEHGIVKMIDIERGFYSSKFIVEETSDGARSEKNFIPITCDFLGIDQNKAEELKRSSPFLRNVVIYTYDKSKGS